MKILKKRKKAPEKDAKKESIFKDLALVLESAGYVVRREKLKTGYGWKVLSGQCKCDDNKYIFVDSQLPQDDQIDFLMQKMQSLGIEAAAKECAK